MDGGWLGMSKAPATDRAEGQSHWPHGAPEKAIEAWK